MMNNYQENPNSPLLRRFHRERRGRVNATATDARCGCVPYSDCELVHHRVADSAWSRQQLAGLLPPTCLLQKRDRIASLRYFFGAIETVTRTILFRPYVSTKRRLERPESGSSLLSAARKKYLIQSK
ncbi:hypothetical protein Y032_0313g2186 [Ancylostoma ceylanicum]|uniref:Uncharacterized protein n=1 Tax=Ancylostoma ceylanicum TaxID=53326 RepID=A0A016S1U7_9BILA|nr:hypothetical protein Y032_0313g2186 [Ancylostoma ceylanicum]